MKAIVKKYFQEFADNIEFPTIIYIYETEKVISYNELAKEFMETNITSVAKVIRLKKINLEEVIKNNGTKIFYNMSYGIKKENCKEVDVELNVIDFEDKHIIVVFFEYSYKQAFAQHMKSWLPRFTWKDNKSNFLCMNTCFVSDLEFLHTVTFPVSTRDIMDVATTEKLESDEEYVMNKKVPLMKTLQLIKSDNSEGYFCSINRIPLINSNGSVAGIIGSYKLIFNQHEQKKLYDAILRCNNTLSDLISRSDTVIISLRKDVSFHLDFVSPNVSYYGYHPELFYKKEVKFSDIVWKEDYSKVLTFLEELENGRNKYFEKKITIYNSSGEATLVKISIGVFKKINSEMYIECQIQRSGSTTKSSRTSTNKQAGMIHLALDTWESSKKQEQLTKAISERCKEFAVYYQPIVEVKSGSIIGVEALLRWSSPHFGDVKPLDFLSMSEYLGLMDRIGYFSIREAIKTYCQLQKHGISDVKMHINLSLVQLFQPNFVKQLVALTDSNNVERDQIVLEIKEGLAVEDLELMKKALLEIKEQGFSIALDNFGVSFIDVHCIMDMPFDYIKLDKKFMDTYGSGKFNGALVVAMLDMIKSMKAEIIVEGIETIKQYEFLLFHEVQAYQGFFFSKPIEKKRLLSSIKLLSSLK